MHRNVYPFSAIIGQETLKLGLLLNAVNPAIGGILIRGEKGTAKSTAVRGLAALLPEIEVVSDCAYSCHPGHTETGCDECMKRPAESLKSTFRRVRVVNHPLNATEDRVSGGIDFSIAVRDGQRALQPGLLASANRGILYIDEVNLLDDNIVDIVLDSASSGENIIEREGISFRHPARFILAGTMNPEEGELRPQLLDRFGLCVEIEASREPDDRVLLMQKRDEFDADPAGFIASAANENNKISVQIENAKEKLAEIRIPGHLRSFISELCTENNVAGHRADIVMEQAAIALAAFQSADEVTVDHIQQVAPMVLLHRRRDAQPPPPQPPEPEENDPKDNQDDSPEDNSDDNDKNQDKQPEQEDTPGENQHPEDMEPESNDRTEEEQIFEIGETFKTRQITSKKDRIFRRGSGRRSRTRASQKQGRYIKSSLEPRHNDIAIDATLRAAAPYQKRRNSNNGMRVVLEKQDLRGKIREKRIGNYLFFVVDASGSIGARGRMVASKGAVMSLLLDAYQKRDKVSMISFRKNDAVVNLPPTTSVDLAGKLLTELPIGGRTPLSAGLVKSTEQVRNVLLKDPSAKPIVILITDGKSNVAIGDEKPVNESMKLASAIAMDERVRYIVVDTEEKGIVSFGLAEQLAVHLKAEYFKIDDLKAKTLVDITKGFTK
ncbi:MAG: putative cobaltochelatase [Desulfobacteraceae bacterium]|jgi:magnesium chelatase subunit D